MESLNELIGSEIAARAAVLTGVVPRHSRTKQVRALIESECRRLFEPFGHLGKVKDALASENDVLEKFLLEGFQQCKNFHDDESFAAFLLSELSERDIESNKEVIAFGCDRILRTQLGETAMISASAEIQQLLQSMLEGYSRFQYTEDFLSDDFRQNVAYLVQAIPAWFIPRKLAEGSIPPSRFEESSSWNWNEGHYANLGEVSLKEHSQAPTNSHWFPEGFQLLIDCNHLDRQRFGQSSSPIVHPTYKGVIPPESIRAILSNEVRAPSVFDYKRRDPLLDRAEILIRTTPHVLRTGKPVPIIPANACDILRWSSSSEADKQRLFEAIYPCCEAPLHE